MQVTDSWLPNMENHEESDVDGPCKITMSNALSFIQLIKLEK